MNIQPNRLILLILIIFNQLVVKSNSQLSKYQKALQTADKKEQVELKIKISQLYFDEIGNIDSMLFFAESAEKQAIEINYSDGKLKAGKLKVLGWARLGEMPKAEKYIDQLLQEVKKSKDGIVKGDILEMAGFIQYLKDKNDKAIDYYLQAMKWYKAENHIEGLATIYCKIGSVFSIQNQFDECKKYSTLASALLPKLKSPFYKCSVHNSLSGLFLQVGVKYQNYIDSSIWHGQKALELVDQYGYYSKGPQLCISIGSSYSLQLNFEKAIYYCKKSLDYRKYMFNYDYFMTYANMVDCYINLNRYDLAAIYFDSIEIHADIDHDLYYKSETAERGYFIYRNLGNTERALKYLETWKATEDTMQNNEKLSRINQLEKKFNKVEDEKKIQKLNLEKETLEKQNELDQLNIRLLIFSIVISVLLIAVIVFFFRQTVLKNKFREIEIEQRLNRARINPHFFFNALVSVQELSLNKERQQEVPIYLSRYARIMRMTLESSYNELISVEEELLFLEEYIAIQKLRFPDKFDFQIIGQEEVYEYYLPGMILQPFIENSIEHGFKNSMHRGVLKLEFQSNKDSLSIKIQDNGSGEKTSSKNYPSRASQIIADRLLLLNKKYRSKAEFKVLENETKVGYTILITLPLLDKP